MRAGPALAQDAQFGPAPIEVCLFTSEGAVRADFVGLAAMACMDEQERQSTVGMTGCLGVELKHWEERVNAALERLKEAQKTVEGDVAASGSSASKPAEALRDMQCAWMQWGAASWLCTAVGGVAGPAAGRQPTSVRCA
jgi:uncharacterized protein YecT (DUF1311 family)